MPRPTPSEVPSAKDLLVHEMLERIADKWTLLAIDALEDGPRRFGEVRRRVGRVSQKMLTKTLRQLERDGLVERRVFAEVPPRVEYSLTPRGRALGAAVCDAWRWAARHAAEVQKSRASYDSAHRSTTTSRRAPSATTPRPAGTTRLRTVR
jgi:DNA-binding HxlR family transcriptional regulator